MLRALSITLVVLVAVAGLAFLFVEYRSTYALGQTREDRTVRIERGMDVFETGRRLEAEGLVASRWYFVYYFARHGLRGQTVAGEYLLSGSLTVPEIARILTEGDVRQTAVQVTFPEGWDMKKMAERLSANGLPGEAFLRLAQRPLSVWQEEHPFLQELPEGASLEGFLFPDTYLFARTATAEDIIAKMLDAFGEKAAQPRPEAPARGDFTPYQTLVLASIVENEVPTAADRRKVADIFLRRLAAGQRLESDATIKYILGKNVIQHSVEETRTPSPYNTYVNAGLPPGPIGNPGLEAIDAVLNPEPNPYFFFLSDPKTGATVFSVTFEEHKQNKLKYGL